MATELAPGVRVTESALSQVVVHAAESVAGVRVRRPKRRVACSRSASQTISFATIGSYIGETSPYGPTPESTRTPGPAGSRYDVMRPGAGRNPAATSSALMRHSIA